MNTTSTPGCQPGATATRRSATLTASMRAMKMAMGSARFTSTPSRASGRCCAPGCARTAVSRRTNCRCISVLPVRAQRPPPRQGSAQRPRRRLDRVRHSITPEPNKSLKGLSEMREESPANRVGSYWVPGWWIVSSDDCLHQGAKQGFAALTGVVHELEEAEIQRQLVLRDTAVRTQPGTQQRPEALNGVDVDFAKTVAILITGILTTGMAHRLVAIAPSWQACIDVILIGVNQRARCDRIADDRLDRCLLHLGQHVQNNLSVALDQAEDRRLVLFQRA